MSYTEPEPANKLSRFIDTALHGMLIVFVVPIFCVTVIASIPFWIVGCIAERLRIIR
jgi:lipopolysaccharide/colanic/teichoic acid biosynthesis glycosyltransferase